jgi:hypothetical protein
MMIILLFHLQHLWLREGPVAYIDKLLELDAQKKYLHIYFWGVNPRNKNTSGGEISSYFAAINIDAQPTSCSLLRETLRLARKRSNIFTA